MFIWRNLACCRRVFFGVVIGLAGWPCITAFRPFWLCAGGCIVRLQRIVARSFIRVSIWTCGRFGVWLLAVPIVGDTLSAGRASGWIIPIIRFGRWLGYPCAVVGRIAVGGRFICVIRGYGRIGAGTLFVIECLRGFAYGGLVGAVCAFGVCRGCGGCRAYGEEKCQCKGLALR